MSTTTTTTTDSILSTLAFYFYGDPDGIDDAIIALRDYVFDGFNENDMDALEIYLHEVNAELYDENGFVEACKAWSDFYCIPSVDEYGQQVIFDTYDNVVCAYYMYDASYGYYVYHV